MTRLQVRESNNAALAFDRPPECNQFQSGPIARSGLRSASAIGIGTGFCRTGLCSRRRNSISDAPNGVQPRRIARKTLGRFRHRAAWS